MASILSLASGGRIPLSPWPVEKGHTPQGNRDGGRGGLSSVCFDGNEIRPTIAEPAKPHPLSQPAAAH